VRRFRDEWLEMRNADALATPAAEARLAETEGGLRALAERLDAIEAGAHAAVDSAMWRQDVERRVRRAELSARPAGVPTALLNRIETLEQRLGELPAAPMPVGPCPACGGVLFTAVACSRCAAGHAA
jgi:hypothetical protein